MSGQLVFDMMEDLLATDITIEQVDTRTEPSTTGCIVKIGGNHPVSKETADYGAKVNVAMEDSNEDDDEVLLLGNWEDVMVEDYDMLYKHLYAEYKDFDKLHRANQHRIHGLEGELKGLYSRIQELEAKIHELKELDKEELKKPGRSTGFWEGPVDWIAQKVQGLARPVLHT
jgi:hypothetical protein